MSGFLYDVKNYADMLREREQAMENGTRYNELGELNMAIDQKRRELFGEREAVTICKEAEDGHRYYSNQ